METKKLILLIICTVSRFSFGQEGPQLIDHDILSISETIPTSTEVSRLGEFGAINATPYNGKANIRVPIYTIEFSGLKIPIGLIYDSGGIKVAQESSWVGLNWELSSNFGINRQIYGTTDFNEFVSDRNGYVYNDLEPDLPNNSEYPYEYEPNDIIRVHESFSHLSTIGSPSKALDTQPDVFTATIFGKSYKFILDKKNPNSSIVQAKVFDSNNVIISFDLNDFSFSLLDENGFTYEFNSKEINTSFFTIPNYQNPISSYQQAFDAIFEDFNRADASLITSWSLDRVVSPTGRVLEFQYEKGLHFTFPQYNFDGDGRDQFIGSVSDEQVQFGIEKMNHFVTTTIIENNYLKEISGDFGSVIFNLGNRLDLCTGSSIDALSDGSFGSYFLLTSQSTIRACHGIADTCGETTTLLPLKLNSILVQDIGNKEIMNVQLVQSYFDSDKMNDPIPERYLRLKLDEIVIGDKKYNFSYINRNHLPAKDSDGIDFWGYANGAESNNDGIVPSIGRFITRQLIGFQDNTPRIGQQFANYNGADRKSRFNFGKVGLLNGIIYPTGGATEFFYEPNEIVLAVPRQFKITESFTSGPTRYRWTEMVDESRFDNTYHYLKKAKSPGYNYFELEDPDVQGNPILLEYGLNQIFEIDFNSIANVETYMRVETGVDGLNFWGNNVLVAIENVATGIEHPVFYFSDAPSVLAGEPQFRNATIPLSPGNYRLVKKGITLPGGNYGDYPPTPAINTINLKLLLDTFESEDIVEDSYLERFEIGGARISKIIHRDIQGNFIKGSEYEYDFPDNFEGLSSSGRLMDDLIFYKKAQGYYSYTNRGTESFQLTGQNMVGGHPSAMGSHIGYSFVREYPIINEQGENLGWIDRTYHNVPNEYFTESSILPFKYNTRINGTIISPLGTVSTQNTIVLGLPLRLGYGYANGNVLEEAIYDANGVQKSRTINEYIYLNGDQQMEYFASFQGYKLSIQLYSDPQENINTMEQLYYTELGPWGFQNETYFPYQFPLHHGIQAKLFNTKTILYSDTPELSQERILVYDGFTHNLKNDKTYTSRGKIRTQKYFYPYDSESADQVGMGYLMADNMITRAVRTDTYLDTLLLDSRRINFDNSITTANLTLPISVETLKGIPFSPNNHYEEKIVFEKYDPQGKIRQYKNSDGVPVTLIWGYHGSYVVAKLINVTFSEIENSIASIEHLSNLDSDRTHGYLGKEGELRSALDSLRQSVPGGMVTTFTYDPLVGVTSITDPRGNVEYFDYDVENRLKSVFDSNGNLLKDFEYKYSDIIFGGAFSNSPYQDPGPNP